MNPKDEISAALEAIRAGQDGLLRLPLLQQIDALGKELVAFDRQLMGRIITQAPPAQFGGASWAEVLSRRLRISRADAERRISSAAYMRDVDRPSA